MLKDRWIALLLVAMFGLLAACDDDDDEVRLPQRAEAANGLLRHYYDTRTFPSNMTSIKIPEGNNFDERRLTLNFTMLANTIVEDVRIRLYLLPPPGFNPSEQVLDLMARVISPDGTHSAWQLVDFLREGQGDAAYAIDSAAEVIFLNEFNGLQSNGNWRIQLRDPIDDKDGRCVLRNATLRINGGLDAVAPVGGNQTVSIPVNAGPYELPLPYLRGERVFGDIGSFGFNAPMRLDFDFAGGFLVTGFSIEFTIRSSPGLSPEEDLYIGIVTPSGGWVFGQMPEALETFEPDGELFSRWSTYRIGESANVPFLADSFRFLGEPAGGTWSVLLWTVNQRNAGHYLSKDSTDGTDFFHNIPASMTLF
jgi:hypothetical protein